MRVSLCDRIPGSAMALYSSFRYSESACRVPCVFGDVIFWTDSRVAGQSLRRTHTKYFYSSRTSIALVFVFLPLLPCIICYYR